MLCRLIINLIWALFLSDSRTIASSVFDMPSICPQINYFRFSLIHHTHTHTYATIEINWYLGSIFILQVTWNGFFSRIFIWFRHPMIFTSQINWKQSSFQFVLIYSSRQTLCSSILSKLSECGSYLPYHHFTSDGKYHIDHYVRCKKGGWTPIILPKWRCVRTNSLEFSNNNNSKNNNNNSNSSAAAKANEKKKL